MTNQEFLTGFLMLYDKVSTLQLPSWEPTEISIFASQEQELLVKSYYNSQSNRLKEGFEETEKRIQDLGELVKNTILTPAAYNPLLNMDNGVFVTLPNTLITSGPTDYSDVFWFTVFEEAITDMVDPCDTTKFLKLEIYETNHNEYKQLISDPFNRPTNKRVWRMRITGRQQELITDGTYNITGYHFRYIAKPTPIDLTGLATATVSQLSDEVHLEILKKTVQAARAAVKDYQPAEYDAKTPKE
jgi:hypothetical protein